MHDIWRWWINAAVFLTSLTGWCNDEPFVYNKRNVTLTSTKEQIKLIQSKSDNTLTYIYIIYISVNVASYSTTHFRQ